jgi:L-malate glycosyltransferase
MQEGWMYKVLIIQAEMKRYRVPFHKKLHQLLREENVEVVVAYSNSNPVDALQGDSTDLPPEIGIKVPGYWLFGRVLYQPLWKQILAADLVIVGPEIKYLVNSLLLPLSSAGLKTVAFWGLGPNKRSDRSPLAEKVKARLFNRVDWWFAYTESVASYLKLHGMDPDRITDVQNATDSTDLRRLMGTITQQEVQQSRVALTGSPKGEVGLYCGVMKKLKDLPFLLETARLVKQQRPEFHLVLIGNGPDRPWLEQAIAHEPWIHYLGSQYGRESALYYKLADLFLLAGSAGLAIVDCFAAGLPILATELATHPPEISYIQQGENGFLAPHKAEAFAASIVQALADPAMLKKLRDGAARSGSRYTMEAMVANYAAGIKSCLSSCCAPSTEDGHLQSSPRYL